MLDCGYLRILAREFVAEFCRRLGSICCGRRPSSRAMMQATVEVLSGSPHFLAPFVGLERKELELIVGPELRTFVAEVLQEGLLEANKPSSAYKETAVFHLLSEVRHWLPSLPLPAERRYQAAGVLLVSDAASVRRRFFEAKRRLYTPVALWCEQFLRGGGDAAELGTHKSYAEFRRTAKGLPKRHGRQKIGVDLFATCCQVYLRESVLVPGAQATEVVDDFVSRSVAIVNAARVACSISEEPEDPDRGLSAGRLDVLGSEAGDLLEYYRSKPFEQEAPDVLTRLFWSTYPHAEAVLSATTRRKFDVALKMELTNRMDWLVDYIKNPPTDEPGHNPETNAPSST